MATSQREPYPFVTNVIDLFGDWLNRRRESDQAHGVGRGGEKSDPLAPELSVTPAVLALRSRTHQPLENELPYTLTALGIDEKTLWRAEPALLHDMERVCSSCSNKCRCHQELAAGTAAMNYVEYCENADAIDTLRLKGAPVKPSHRRN